ncbi:MAG: outer membrane lipoprotein chaperone LolA [Azoarcus sp.]|jgi:outer membrane lipoprotein carrier protein|nr:outer membrane lipoprotein chaperone LolA [Azoarcus sp.]
MKGMRVLLAVILLSLAGSAAAAVGAVGRLQQFVTSARSAEGEFKQTVIGESGRPPQQASGKFAFARPGKFRWEYDLPYPQLLVGDGKQLWSWDRDLNQVTVRPIGSALGATPAAILFGEDRVDRDFTLSEGVPANDAEAALKLAWIEAHPRQPVGEGSGGFQTIRFGFEGERLQRMVLRDNFGQTTLIEFVRLRLNPKLDAATFHFEPPAGADILGVPSPQQ